MEFLSQGTVPHLISSYGYWAVGGIVAVESMGIPLPGETALITAALIAASTQDLKIWFVILAGSAGAINWLIARKNECGRVMPDGGLSDLVAWHATTTFWRGGARTICIPFTWVERRRGLRAYAAHLPPDKQGGGSRPSAALDTGKGMVSGSTPRLRRRERGVERQHGP
jgi:hypothetical protein